MAEHVRIDPFLLKVLIKGAREAGYEQAAARALVPLGFELGDRVDEWFAKIDREVEGAKIRLRVDEAMPDGEWKLER